MTSKGEKKMIITSDHLQFLKDYSREETRKKEKGEEFCILDLFHLPSDKNFANFGFSAVEISKLTRVFGKENADLVKNIGKRQRGTTRCVYYQRI
jgi:hypothetical protein